MISKTDKLLVVSLCMFIGIVALLAGTCFGRATAHETSTVTQAKPKIITKMVTVHDTETVHETVVPRACLSLATESQKIIKSGETFDRLNTHILDELANIRIAAATLDFSAANEIEDRVRVIIDGDTGVMMNIGNAKTNISKLVNNCQEGIN